MQDIEEQLDRVIQGAERQDAIYAEVQRNLDEIDRRYEAKQRSYKAKQRAYGLGCAIGLVVMLASIYWLWGGLA